MSLNFDWKSWHGAWNWFTENLDYYYPRWKNDPMKEEKAKKWNEDIVTKYVRDNNMQAARTAVIR